MISYNWAYIEYSRRRNCHSFFFISTSKLMVIVLTLDPPRFYCGRRRFRVFELLLSCDLNWFPVSPSAFLFCHICGRANSTWTYYSRLVFTHTHTHTHTHACTHTHTHSLTHTHSHARTHTHTIHDNAKKNLLPIMPLNAV